MYGFVDVDGSVGVWVHVCEEGGIIYVGLGEQRGLGLSRNHSFNNFGSNDTLPNNMGLVYTFLEGTKVNDIRPAACGIRPVRNMKNSLTLIDKACGNRSYHNHYTKVTFYPLKKIKRRLGFKSTSTTTEDFCLSTLLLRCNDLLHFPLVAYTFVKSLYIFMKV